MTTPSSSMKVKQEPKQKKNVYQHMAEALGHQTIKLAKGQLPLLETVKKIIVSLAIFMAIGFIIGMIIDMFIDSPYPMANILALFMLLIWLLKNGKGYLWNKSR